MIIIAESGATKTDWCAIAADGQVQRVQTAGINVATMPAAVMQGIAEEAVSALRVADAQVSEIHFYAAGLIGEAPQGLDGVFRALFPEAVLEYASDLLDAARAVCGHEAGIAGILGTGSNSCFYDGVKVEQKVRSGGFILGDEGSGAVLGKRFLADFLKGRLPGPLAEEFASKFDVAYTTVVREVYKGPAPSKYLGQFAPFIAERYGQVEYVTELMERNFRDYIERCLCRYDIGRYPVGIVGGFGYAHRELLQRLGAAYGIRFSKIIASPMEGLIEYHSYAHN